MQHILCLLKYFFKIYLDAGGDAAVHVKIEQYGSLRVDVDGEVSSRGPCKLEREANGKCPA